MKAVDLLLPFGKNSTNPLNITDSDTEFDVRFSKFPMSDPIWRIKFRKTA